MKFFRLVIVVLSFGLISSLNAQELKTTTIVNDTFEVTALKKNLSTYSFLAGDTIVIRVSEIEGKELHQFIIQDVNSAFQKIAKKQAVIEERIIVTADTDFNFIFNHKPSITAPLGFKRNIHINIVKEEYFVPEVIEVNDFVETVEVTLSDTINQLVQSDTAFAPVINEDFFLGSVIEPGKQTRKSIELTPVPGATYYVYWIGVGNQAKKDYEQVKVNMPLEWAALGIIEPVDAFAMGKLRQMPIQPEGEDVFVAVVDVENKNSFQKKQSFQPRFQRQGVVTYGIIDGELVPENAQTFICLANDNAVSPIDVSVKIIAVTINNTYEEIIKDTVITVQKVFRLNTEALTIAEARAEIIKKEKELGAAWIRAYEEHQAAQKALDAAWEVRQLELKQAAANIEASWSDVKQKEETVNEVLEAQVQEKIVALESDQTCDSMTMAAMKKELQTILDEIKKARVELEEVEVRRKQLNELIEKDINEVTAETAKRAMENLSRTGIDAAGNKIDEVLGGSSAPQEDAGGGN